MGKFAVNHEYVAYNMVIIQLKSVCDYLLPEISLLKYDSIGDNFGRFQYLLWVTKSSGGDVSEQQTVQRRESQASSSSGGWECAVLSGCGWNNMR